MSTFAIHPVEVSRVKHNLRPAHIDDAEFLFQLFVERNTARFALLGWSDVQLRSMLQMQYRARAAGYAQQFAGLESLVVCTAHQQPVGEVLIHRADQEIRIVDICISTEYRKQGIGTQLLLELQQKAATAGSAITLSVDHGNRARRLYERLGFHETRCNALQAEMRWRCVEVDASQIGERVGTQVNFDA
jgi:ribosomal protein S18 acetylase RimI-like enzyme